MTYTRDDIVGRARAWAGTPYHHQASVRGVGCDCLGLVRGVYRELEGREPQEIPAYTPDWGESLRADTLLEAGQTHLVEIDAARALPGDVLLFRLRPNAMAKHLGLLVSDGTMIHAFEAAPACEVHLGPWWRRRIAAAFAFPGVA